MIIASRKHKENIAEYLLYMWQIEDIIRANGLDLGKIRANVIDRFSSLTQQQRDEMAGWYESLVDMMRREGVERSGHLQINRNVMSSVSELHRALLADPRFAGYAALFYKTLPYIVELRSRAGDTGAQGEIETCFTALYGMMMMRLPAKRSRPTLLRPFHAYLNWWQLLPPITKRTSTNRCSCLLTTEHFRRP